MNAQRIGESERLEVNLLIDAVLEGKVPPIAPRFSWPLEAIRASQALPSYESWTGFFGINRDGELVYVEDGPAFSIVMLVDPRSQRTALFEASKRFPTLKSLLPRRPEHARTCPNCNGTGRINFGTNAPAMRKLAEHLVCDCGGLGWLPKDE